MLLCAGIGLNISVVAAGRRQSPDGNIVLFCYLWCVGFCRNDSFPQGLAVKAIGRSRLRGPSLGRWCPAGLVGGRITQLECSPHAGDARLRRRRHLGQVPARPQRRRRNRPTRRPRGGYSTSSTSRRWGRGRRARRTRCRLNNAPLQRPRHASSSRLPMLRRQASPKGWPAQPRRRRQRLIFRACASILNLAGLRDEAERTEAGQLMAGLLAARFSSQLAEHVSGQDRTENPSVTMPLRTTCL
ncbi:unnamed protein product [Protopolystoma xenopodis]|uniref:Uncharacterized protein n=1 Tax=Protopolystoma xenopodis TaxID=117903 RepID=A0A448X444_9PLAT|nr:unnamed protein product [Protopolystoma xenopodis]